MLNSDSMGPKQPDASPESQTTPPPIPKDDEPVFHYFLELPYETRQCVFKHFFFRSDGISPPDLLATLSTVSRAPPSIFIPLLFKASQQIAQDSVASSFEVYSFGTLPPAQTRRWKTLVPPPSTFFPPIFKVSKQFAMEAVAPFFEANTWVVTSSLQTKYLWKWVVLSNTQKYLRSLTFDPVTRPPKYGPNLEDIFFMNTCPGLTSVAVAMSQDPLVMQDQRWDLAPCPIESIIGPTSLKGLLGLQNLKLLTFECQFSSQICGKRCWNAVEQLVRWFAAEFLESNKRVEVVAKLIDAEGVKVDVYGST
jgi:hypothetical protein